jgi:hypothetical protein
MGRRSQRLSWLDIVQRIFALQLRPLCSIKGAYFGAIASLARLRVSKRNDTLGNKTVEGAIAASA